MIEVDESEEEEEEVVVELLDDEPMQVAPGLFIGPVDAAAPHKLAAHGIENAVRCFAEPDGPPVGLELDWRDEPDQPIREGLHRALDFIHAARGRPVFVYCVAGRSRSAAVLAGWLVHREGRTAGAAVELIQQTRPWVAPNSGFVSQLEGCQAELAAAVAQVAGGPPEPVDGSVLRWLPRVHFAPRFVEVLRSGSKLATTRVRGERDTDRGSELDVLQVCAEAVLWAEPGQEGRPCLAVVGKGKAVQVLSVVRIEWRRFDQVDDALAEVEGMADAAALQRVLGEFYPGVQPDDPIQVIHFRPVNELWPDTAL